MSDVQKLLKRNPKPSQAQVKKAEAGERGEGVRAALKAGRGDVVAGAKRLGLTHEGLPEQLKHAKNCPCPLHGGKGKGK